MLERATPIGATAARRFAVAIAEARAAGRIPGDLAARLAAGIAAEPPLALGEVLRGRYAIGRLLGRGSVASVFAATDARRLEAGEPDPEVALKVLGLGLVHDLAARGALFREARLAARLAHPNLVRVLDYDAEGPLAFVVMERLHGWTMETLIDGRGGMGWAQAAALGRQVAAALAHAHGRLVAHGDLKPENLLIDRAGEVKLLDFGAARGLGPSGPVAAFAGFTPRYATRELAAGAAPEPQDDLHALAVILHRLATGDPGDPAGEPARPAGIGRRAWQALRAALVPRRDAQPAGAEAFAREILG
jgi:serine/threonine protein kinase